VTLPHTDDLPTVDRGIRPAAVLWDMDGTLVDTEPYWFAAEYDLVEEFGTGTWSDELAHQMIGSDLLDGAAFLQQHAGVDLPALEIVERLLDGVIARLHREIPWRPGALELLDRLHAAGIPCALVTMSWRRFVDPVVAALPPRTFVATITGDEVPEGHGKPSPTPYLLGAEACDADPAACIAIEDSPTGVRSALSAGCRVLGVHNIRRLEPEPGLTVVESLDGIDVPTLADLLAPDHPDLAPPAPPGRWGRRTSAGGDSLRFDRRAIAVLAVLTVVALGAFVLTRGDDGPPPLPPGAVPIDVWVPYWTLGDTVPEVGDRLPQVREASPFWFGSRGATEIVVDEQTPSGLAESFLGAIDGSPARLVPSIRDEMPAGGMAGVLADPATRRRHVETILEFADEYDVDGIDLDYEQFAFADGSDTWDTTRPNWVAFVTELAEELHSQDRTLTISIPGVWGVVEEDGEIVDLDGYPVYDHGAIAEHVDAIRIMAYDYSVATAGPIAPIAWVQDVVDGTSAVVPEEHHDKLVLGVPSYGSNWVSSTLGECPETAEGRTNVTSRSVAELAERRGGLPLFDPVTGEWSFAYALNVTDGTTSCVQNREVHWVDAEGIESRVEIARRAGWGGVALWALGYEDDAAWQGLVSGSRRTLTP
jgi:HAD superfamily hydrolase (TIGR01509 family)